MKAIPVRFWSILGAGALLSGACAKPDEWVFPSDGEPASAGAGTGGASVASGGWSAVGAANGVSGSVSVGATAGTAFVGSGGAMGGNPGAGGNAGASGNTAFAGSFSFGAGGLGGSNGGSSAMAGAGGSAGGAQTGGASGFGNTGPCANPMDAAGTNTGNFGTLGPACFRTQTVFSGGWNCSSTDGRTIKINGHVLECGFIPVPPQIDGYTYIEATAGTYTWAQVYWWT